MSDLRALIEAHWAKLTPNQQRIGEYALSNPFLVATMGIEDLAEASAVSAPTITRFVRQLGLKNYAEFRAIAVRRYQDLLRPIDNVSRAQESSSAEVITTSLASATGNLDGLAGLSPALCDNVVDQMAAANQVGFLGFGSSALGLTYFHGLTEGFLRNSVILDGRGGHERIARQIGRMGPHDVLIAMALPRYSLATVEFLRLARASAVPCIGITDSDQSPICQFCDQIIRLPVAHPVLNSSALAAFAMFEAIAALFTARYQSASDATVMTRLIFPYLCTDEDSSQPPSEDNQ